jgi:hypothetical protein
VHFVAEVAARPAAVKLLRRAIEHWHAGVALEEAKHRPAVDINS